jgi:hypothetical protein
MAIVTVPGRVKVNPAHYPNRNAKEVHPEEPLKIPVYPAQWIFSAWAGDGNPRHHPAMISRT